jgi:hypothetical protein
VAKQAAMVEMAVLAAVAWAITAQNLAVLELLVRVMTAAQVMDHLREAALAVAAVVVNLKLVLMQ